MPTDGKGDGGLRKWLPMAGAPRDGAVVSLLIDYRSEDSWLPLEDAMIAPTIGSNNFDNDGENVWRFAGWDWNHDYWCEGKGEPVGWLPWRAAMPWPAGALALTQPDPEASRAPSALTEAESGYIWSGEHNAYWRPKSSGYTCRVKAAGLYSRAEAEAIMRGAGPEKKLEFEPASNAPTEAAKPGWELRERPVGAVALLRAEGYEWEADVVESAWALTAPPREEKRTSDDCSCDKQPMECEAAFCPRVGLSASTPPKEAGALEAAKALEIAKGKREELEAEFEAVLKDCVGSWAGYDFSTARLLADVALRVLAEAEGERS